MFISQYNIFIRIVFQKETHNFFFAVLSAVGGIKQKATTLTQGTPIYASCQRDTAV